MQQNIYTEEELYWSRGGNTGMLPTNITPSQVNVLKDLEIFVFGSNFQGAHMGGAARGIPGLPLVLDFHNHISSLASIRQAESFRQ